MFFIIWDYAILAEPPQNWCHVRSAAHQEAQVMLAFFLHCEITGVFSFAISM